MLKFLPHAPAVITCSKDFESDEKPKRSAEIFPHIKNKWLLANVSYQSSVYLFER